MVRVSSLDGDPVYSYERASERSDRRNRWPMFSHRRGGAQCEYIYTTSSTHARTKVTRIPQDDDR